MNTGRLKNNFTGSAQSCCSMLSGIFFLLCAFAAYAQQGGDWLNVVRDSPYWESQGVAENLSTIRRWVLFSEAYCESPNRHLLLNRRWQFLAYIENADNSEQTLLRLNERRELLAEEGRVDQWVAGAEETTGYPFALSCNQPFTNMDEAIARVTGGQPDYLLWGTWDGMRIGTESDPVSLRTLFYNVVDHRREQERLTFPTEVIPEFLGKIIIESGGDKNALSSESAVGILQLVPEVLDDCEIPERFHKHRIAQVDCALKLMEQNHRNLATSFTVRFGHLTEGKRIRLYSLLLIQAYQIGVGRTVQLLEDDELGRAARYFADNSEQFSAEDILVGMIYHNMGRKDLGLMTLYYVTDTGLATQSLH